MFVKLPVLVLLAVAAILCLAAPTADADELSVREPKRRPGLASYPKCGAPICKRDGDDAELDLVNRAANVAGSELSSKRDVQIDCQKRLRCPPGGKSTKVKGRCLCLPTKLVRDVSGLNSIEEAVPQTLKRDVQINCQKRLRCPPGGKSTKVKGRCLCLPTKLVRDVSELSSIEEAIPQTLRRHAKDDSDDAPVDCASIAKCRGNQHPVNIASDRCECIDNDMPDAAPLDCASIAKCSKGAHPIKYNGYCVCVPWFPNQQEERDLSLADASL
ncbi:MAG: hypothetical protein Q9171_001005 [Xanthocarpia ochracea]